MQKSTIYRKPLTDEQKQNNRIKSKDRCRIEHIFGFVERAMNDSLVRSIGMMRAKSANALTNLVYNIFPSFAAVCTINSIKVVKYQQISAK